MMGRSLASVGDSGQAGQAPRPNPYEGIPGHVYLLHFREPFTVNGVTLVQHYLGWTADLRRRLRDHARGRGSRVTQKAHAQGVGFVLARTWPGTVATERDLRAEGPRNLCPHCAGAGRLNPDRRK
jgi:hypothetical protein